MPLHLNAIATAERLATIARVRQALTASGAWILDHRTFSNQSCTIDFEIDAPRLPVLAAALALAGLHFNRASEALLAPPPGDSTLHAASLQITFFHAEPDLRDTIPSVPG